MTSDMATARKTNTIQSVDIVRAYDVLPHVPSLAEDDGPAVCVVAEGRRLTLPAPIRLVESEPLTVRSQGLARARWNDYDPHYCVRLKNVYWSGHSTFVTEDGRLYSDLTQVGSFRYPVNSDALKGPFDAFKAKGTAVVHEGPHAALVWGTASLINHSHWLVQTLPRLNTFTRAGMPRARLVTFPETREYQYEQLETLGYGKDNVTVIDHTDLHFFEELYVCYTPPHLYDDPAVFDRLIEAYGTQDSQPECIYVSRSDALGMRRFINETKISEILRHNGFQIVVPSTLSARDEVRVFQAARIVMGPLGAGLYNLVFTRPGSTCIAMSDPAYFMDWLAQVCHQRGHEWGFVTGSSFDSFEHVYAGTHNNWVMDPYLIESIARDIRTYAGV